MEPVPSTIVKTYPPRGPLQQYRLAHGAAFRCFRCGQTKTSRLITVYNGDWQKRLCNGCYGRLLSLFEIPAGDESDDEHFEALAAALLAALTAEEAREAARLYLAAETRSEVLSPEAFRFVSTAEYVGAQLGTVQQMDWSPAIIGLCKAVEIELVRRYVEPLRRATSGLDLAQDIGDRDLRAIARYCAGQTGKSPEIGTFAYFLQTAISSVQRRETSPLVNAFMGLASSWTGSSWILDRGGLYSALNALTGQFRNPAAHADEMDQLDYEACREVVVGTDGLLWRMALAVQPHAK